MSLGDGETDGVGDPLPERSGRHLHAGGEVALWMAGRAASPLPECAQLRKRKVIPVEVKEGVEESRSVTGGEDESVAVRPARVPWIMAQIARPEDVRHRRGAERQPRVTRIGRLHGVNGQESQRVDAPSVDRLPLLHDLPQIPWRLARTA